MAELTLVEAVNLALHHEMQQASVEAAVEFACLKDEAAAFAERDDFLHADGVGMLLVGHNLGKTVGREEISPSPRGQGAIE